MISEIDLNFYTNDGENFELALSPTQAKVVIAVLGLTIAPTGEQDGIKISSRTDDFLKEHVLPNL